PAPLPGPRGRSPDRRRAAWAAHANCAGRAGRPAASAGGPASRPASRRAWRPPGRPEWRGRKDAGPGSFAKQPVLRPERVPALAAGALPVMVAGAETATLAAVAGALVEHALGNLGDGSQHRTRLPTGVAQADLGQAAQAGDGGMPTQLARQESLAGLLTLRTFDFLCQGQHRTDPRVAGRDLGEEFARALVIAQFAIAGDQVVEQQRHHIGIDANGALVGTGRTREIPGLLLQVR